MMEGEQLGAAEGGEAPPGPREPCQPRGKETKLQLGRVAWPKGRGAAIRQIFLLDPTTVKVTFGVGLKLTTGDRPERRWELRWELRRE